MGVSILNSPQMILIEMVIDPNCCASLFLLLLLLLILFHRRPQTPSCPQSYPLIGNLIGFLLNRHRFHDWVTDMLSSTPSLTIQVNGFLGLSHGICTAHPTNLHHLLRSNFPNYIKGSRFTSVLHELLGAGIFNSDAHLWSSQRKIASYEFNTKSLRTFISRTLHSQISQSLIPYLADNEKREEIIDLQQVLRKFSLDSICKVGFGVDPGSLRSKGENHKALVFAGAFELAVEHCSKRFMSPLQMMWKMKRYLNVGSERKYREAMEVVNEFTMGIIKSKEVERGKNGDELDLLSRFMLSTWDDMGLENEEDKSKLLRDIVVSFLLAGKDTTASALTWFFWLLAGHPRCQDLIYKELSQIMSQSLHIHPLHLSFDDLKNFHYLHAALSESMRLFPPVPINTRLTVDNDTLPDGTHIRKGWFADYSAYAMGRMERLWGPDCREFKPERWLDDHGIYQAQASDQFKYPVFHGGPRMCLGKEMAYLQMKSVVVAVMYEFEVEVVDGGGTAHRMRDPPYTLSLLLNMRNGLPVRLKKNMHSLVK